MSVANASPVTAPSTTANNIRFIAFAFRTGRTSRR
jgi:hypothetical protein